MGIENEVIQHYIIVDGKRHLYTLQKMDRIVTFFRCTAAGIDRAVLNSDLAELLSDLPNQIRSKRVERDTSRPMIRFRVSMEEKKFIEEKAYKHHYSISDYFRELVLGPKGDRD